MRRNWECKRLMKKHSKQCSEPPSSYYTIQLNGIVFCSSCFSLFPLVLRRRRRFPLPCLALHIAIGIIVGMPEWQTHLHTILQYFDFFGAPGGRPCRFEILCDMRLKIPFFPPFSDGVKHSFYHGTPFYHTSHLDLNHIPLQDPFDAARETKDNPPQTRMSRSDDFARCRRRGRG